jgi:hypothetical protein
LTALAEFVIILNQPNPLFEKQKGDNHDKKRYF